MPIRYRKLGRNRAWGLYWADGIVEVDSRLRGKRKLSTLIHELLHGCLPAATHATIERTAGTLARALWQERWREVESL